MRFAPPITIMSTGLWLPEKRETTARAVRAGLLEAERADQDGYLELPVSDLAGPQMAVRAARSALAAASVDPATVDAAIHAWIYYQGHDYWTPAHYIISELGMPDAHPLGLQAACNGGLLAVEAAASRMVADPGVRRTLVTTGDRFCPPGFDRWKANYDVLYGDAGTAMVLDRQDGPYELLSTAMVSAPALEAMYRGSDPWAPAARWERGRVDVRGKLKQFLAAGNGPRFAAIAGASVLRAVRSALRQAGIEPDDPCLRYVAPPRFGQQLLERSYLSVLAGATKAEIVNLGRRTGHVGAGDPIANLFDLHRQGMVRPGEVALLLSAAAGFSWCCMVVRARGGDR